MRYPDDGGLKTEGFGLHGGSLFEGGGDDKAASNAALIEVLDIMQTA